MKQLFISIWLCCLTATLWAQPVKQYGQLQVKGIQLCNEKGNAIVLRGVSYGWHNWWPRFYNAQTVKWLASDFKCSILRAAMGVEPDSGYIDKPERSIELISKVVDAAIENGLYVIVDWHCHHSRLNEAKTFFAQIARKYGNYPNVIYEIYNEPEKDNWKQIKAYSESIIATIRSIDPDNIILIGTPRWDQDVNLAANDPIEGQKNIMYTLHYYAATHKQDLRNKGDYALSKGLPLFISECAGMKANGDGKINIDEWNKWIEWSENHKISWISWAISDKNESCSMLLRQASSTGEWDSSVLRKWGKLVREKLNTY